MYFDTNISENKDGKKNEGSYLSCVTNGEFYFNFQRKYLSYIPLCVIFVDRIVG